MIPGLGKNFPIQIEVVSKPRREYKTDDYRATGLPQAPAITISDNVVADKDVSLDFLESVIRKHLSTNT